MEKGLLFDIESANLNANYGFVFCVCYKWHGTSKVHTITIRDFEKFKSDPTCDKEVVKAFQKVVAEADYMVGHYSTRFDLPFLNTRALMHKLKPFAVIPHVDTWKISKYKLKLNSNRLDTLSRIIPSMNERELKTVIEPRMWVRAQSGHVPSIKYIEEHCVADVKVLDQVYTSIRPYCGDHPSVALMREQVGCSVCGSTHTQRRGYHITNKTKKRRMQCVDCGHWFTAKL